MPTYLHGHAQIAEENAVVKTALISAKAQHCFREALDSAACIYDHAASRHRKTRNGYRRIQEEKTMQFAKEVIWYIREAVKELHQMPPMEDA